MERTSHVHRRGRGAGINPAPRFERFHLEEDPEALDDEERRAVPTTFLTDTSRSILSNNDSPDVPFTYSLNPYRGCEHGCVWCYARPTHEYLGFSAGVDFETKILVKEDAATLLANRFEDPKWEPQVIAMSGVTDPYQPVERKRRITRECLEVFVRYRNPVGIVTKNHLVTRDIDLLSDLARDDLARVYLSVTSLNDELTGKMEPRTSRAARRLDAIRRLTDAGIPTGVMVAPVVPGLTDEEMPAILKAAREAGARWASYIVMRLPGAVDGIFREWLEREYPNRVNRVMNRVRQLRGGRPNDPRFGTRMSGTGQWAELFNQLFRKTASRLGYDSEHPPAPTHHFRRSQGELF